MGATASPVSKKARYYIRVNADGTIANQFGEALLTVGIAASVYTITMPAGHTIPINRRSLTLTADVPVGSLGNSATYDSAASAAGTIVVRGAAFGGGASNTAFDLVIEEVMVPA